PYTTLFRSWTALAAAAVALWIIYACGCRSRLAKSRRRVILSLMAFGLLLPLIVLLNPIWVERLPPPAGKPLLTVVLDSSASMGIVDAADGQSRFAAARSIALHAAKELAN